MDLGKLSPNWSGCRLRDEVLITDNKEQYTLPELRCLRWELNNWRRLASVQQRELKRSGMEDSIRFEINELVLIRKVLVMLDNRLPGYRLKQSIMDSFKLKCRA